MLCEHCGSPIETAESDKGACSSCGAVLPHVIRAAEKAEIIRRVVAQGNAVRIDGDRIETSAGPRSPDISRAPLDATNRTILVVIMTGVALGLLVLSAVAFLNSKSVAPLPSVVPPARQTLPVLVPESPATTEPLPVAPPSTPTNKSAAPGHPAAKPPSTNASRSSTERVIAAHKGQYARCHQQELGQNPSAPKRYSLAVTIDASGRAQWVEVLSQASPSMKSCVETVTRTLTFPSPENGSVRSIVTLTFEGRP